MGKRFELQFAEPAGEETVKVIATKKPLDLGAFGLGRFDDLFKKSDFVAIPLKTRAIVVKEAKESLASGGPAWSDDTVVIRAYPRKRRTPALAKAASPAGVKSAPPSSDKIITGRFPRQDVPPRMRKRPEAPPVLQGPRKEEKPWRLPIQASFSNRARTRSRFSSSSSTRPGTEATTG
jgi:hypothetical protein